MIGRRLIVNYLGQGWAALIGMIFVPVYISYLGIAAYGIVGLYVVLVAFLSLLGGGLVPALGRSMARYSGGAVTAEALRDLLRGTETVVIAVAVGIALFLWLASGWLADHWLRIDDLPRDTVADAIAILGFSVACRFVEAIYHASLIGLQRQMFLNAANALIATIRAVGAVAVLAWYEPSIGAYFAWQGVVSLVSVAVLARITYAVLPPAPRPGRFSSERIREVLPYAGGMFTVTALSLLLAQGDKLLLSRLLPLSEYGLYTFASVVASGLVLLTIPVYQSWLPRLVELQSRQDHDKFRSAFHASAQVQTVVTGSLGLVLVAFSGEIIDVWTKNPELDHAARLVSILALGNTFNALALGPNMLQIAYGYTRLLVGAQTVALVVAVPALLIAVTHAGAVGAASVWVATNLGLVLVSSPFLFRNTLADAKWRWYRDDIAMPAAAAGLAILAFRLWAPWPDARIGKLLLLALICGVAVLAAAMAASVTRTYLLTRARAWAPRRPGAAG